MSGEVCPVCGDPGELHVCIPEVCDQLLKSSVFAGTVRTVVHLLSRDKHDLPVFVDNGDGRPCVYFNGGHSRITYDDHCWVIQNKLSEGTWQFTPWIFAEAKAILDKLPYSPDEASKLGMFD